MDSRWRTSKPAFASRSTAETPARPAGFPAGRAASARQLRGQAGCFESTASGPGPPTTSRRTRSGIPARCTSSGPWRWFPRLAGIGIFDGQCWDNCQGSPSRARTKALQRPHCTGRRPALISHAAVARARALDPSGLGVHAIGAVAAARGRECVLRSRAPDLKRSRLGASPVAPEWRATATAALAPARRPSFLLIMIALSFLVGLVLAPSCSRAHVVNRIKDRATDARSARARFHRDRPATVVQANPEFARPAPHRKPRENPEAHMFVAALANPPGRLAWSV